MNTSGFGQHLFHALMLESSSVILATFCYIPCTLCKRAITVSMNSCVSAATATATCIMPHWTRSTVLNPAALVCSASAPVRPKLAAGSGRRSRWWWFCILPCSTRRVLPCSAISAEWPSWGLPTPASLTYSACTPAHPQGPPPSPWQLGIGRCCAPGPARSQVWHAIFDHCSEQGSLTTEGEGNLRLQSTKSKEQRAAESVESGEQRVESRG